MAFSGEYFIMSASSRLKNFQACQQSLVKLKPNDFYSLQLFENVGGWNGNWQKYLVKGIQRNSFYAARNYVPLSRQ